MAAIYQICHTHEKHENPFADWGAVCCPSPHLTVNWIRSSQMLKFIVISRDIFSESIESELAIEIFSSWLWLFNCILSACLMCENHVMIACASATSAVIKTASPSDCKYIAWGFFFHSINFLFFRKVLIRCWQSCGEKLRYFGPESKGSLLKPEASALFSKALFSLQVTPSMHVIWADGLASVVSSAEVSKKAQMK